MIVRLNTTKEIWLWEHLCPVASISLHCIKKKQKQKKKRFGRLCVLQTSMNGER